MVETQELERSRAPVEDVPVRAGVLDELMRDPTGAPRRRELPGRAEERVALTRSQAQTARRSRRQGPVRSDPASHGGLDAADTAEALGVSQADVQREHPPEGDAIDRGAGRLRAGRAVRTAGSITSNSQRP
jgi:hypothetical protein